MMNAAIAHIANPAKRALLTDVSPVAGTALFSFFAALASAEGVIVLQTIISLVPAATRVPLHSIVPSLLSLNVKGSAAI